MNYKKLKAERDRALSDLDKLLSSKPKGKQFRLQANSIMARLQRSDAEFLANSEEQKNAVLASARLGPRQNRKLEEIQSERDAYFQAL